MNAIAALISSLGNTSLATVSLIGTFGKGAILLILAFALTGIVLRRSSASSRHRVWAWALVGVLALPLLSALLPAWNIAVVPPAAMNRTVALLPSPASAPTLETETRRAIGIAPGHPEGTHARPPGSQPWEAGAEPDATGAAPGAMGDDISLGRPGDHEFGLIARAASIPPTTLLAAIWGAGAALLLLRLTVSSLAASWICRRAEPVSDPRWLETARSVQRRLRLSGDVRLVRHPRTTMPMAWGLWRPTVLLPRDADGWPAARRRVVLLHEMAHLKRRDCQTLLMSRLATALHWVNPLVWIASRQLQAERERACDDLVLVAGTRGAEYAEHLLAIARAAARTAAPSWAAVAMARPRELEGRVLAILDPQRDRRGATRPASIVALFAGGVLVPLLAALQPAAAVAPQQAESQALERAVPEALSQALPEAVAGAGARAVPEALAQAVPEALAEGVAQAVPEAAAKSSPLERSSLTPRVEAESSARSRPESHTESRAETTAQAWPMTEERITAMLREAIASAAVAIDEEMIAEVVHRALESVSLDEVSAMSIAEAQELATELAVEVGHRFAHGVRAGGQSTDPRVLQAMLTALEDADWQIREQAAQGLGHIEDAQSAAALAAALRDDEAWQVREQAAWALGKIEDAAAVPALGAAVADEHPQVREQAAWALGMIEDPVAVPELLTALSDTEWSVREQAAWALGMIESAAAVEALGTVLRTDEAWQVRQQAAWALGMIEDESALDALLDALTDENTRVRKQALWAVGHISQ